MKHECSAPICAKDKNKKYKEEVIWYPGEQICTHKPYTRFQQAQLSINEWFRRNKTKDIPLTAKMLEDGVIKKVKK